MAYIELTQPEQDKFARLLQKRKTAKYILEHNGDTPDYATFQSFSAASEGELNVRKAIKMAKSYAPSAPVDPSNGHAYVEIGGIKWATMNVGATAETDTGTYFAWGETTAKEDYSWNTYTTHGNGGSSASDMIKYNSSDGKTELEASDDAVHANWGGNWYMPTKAEFESLTANTTNEWVTDYNGSGINGRLFTSKADSSVKLFFPASGYKTGTSTEDVGSYGGVWSSSLNSNDIRRAWELNFDSGYVYMGDADRYNGFTCRGVLRNQA